MDRINNYLLRPSAAPIVREIDCLICKGTGKVEDEDGAVEYGGLVLTEIVECQTCKGQGKMEIWR